MNGGGLGVFIRSLCFFRPAANCLGTIATNQNLRTIRYTGVTGSQTFSETTKGARGRKKVDRIE